MRRSIADPTPGFALRLATLGLGIVGGLLLVFGPCGDPPDQSAGHPVQWKRRALRWPKLALFRTKFQPAPK
jgi:hypothetical protein